MESLISLKKIVKDYKTMRALNEVDLEIKPGITGLLGPNGAGKSTLIKVLLGLVDITAGSGIMLGHQLGTGGRKIRAKVGYVPEDDCYIPGMSGVEVVQFSACLAGLPYVEALRRAHEILDFCGMKQERYRNIESYSTGMRQKIKFASAIVHDPEFLILDEPTSGLDPEEREALLQRIRYLATGLDKPKSVLISTHILPDVQTVCDQVVIISRGEIQRNESLESLSKPTAPTVTVRVLGDPANFLRLLECNGMEVQTDFTGEIVIAGKNNSVAEDVWGIAQNSGVSIQSLHPARNSLEEIFIETVKEAGHATT
ncbi:ABC transporter ATP-binding protein [bacterium]|nr:ABC transporter ATP-binding protein [bacterium]